MLIPFTVHPAGTVSLSVGCEGFIISNKCTFEYLNLQLRQVPQVKEEIKDIFRITGN